MQDLGTIAMVTALLWPLIGGALVGLIGGLVRRHGLIGTLADIVLGAGIGYGITLAYIRLSGSALSSDALNVAVMLGLPIVGGLIALWLVSRFRRV